jgi:heme-degrading monooxygenase HmoA
MFTPITIPFGAKMLFNTLKLKPGVEMEDVELALGEMCNVVKENYGDEKGGFIAGQVFEFSGFISDEGSLSDSKEAESHVAIVTFWRSFEQHEKSHADKAFKDKFEALGKLCTDSKELGYDMLWQGEPEKNESQRGKLVEAASH